ncbi:MAG: hypothetical protein ABEK59_10405 [Halobacteria archaeon]
MSKSDIDEEIEKNILSLYNILYEDSLESEDIELYELKRETDEGEIYLPHIGINYELWREWNVEKRIEVLIHEFAHDEKYSDDHHPDFWDRVVERTKTAVCRHREIEEEMGDFEPAVLKDTVVDSIHRGVIETDIDTVAERKRNVRNQLNQRKLDSVSEEVEVP